MTLHDQTDSSLSQYGQASIGCYLQPQLPFEHREMVADIPQATISIASWGKRDFSHS